MQVVTVYVPSRLKNTTQLQITNKLIVSDSTSDGFRYFQNSTEEAYIYMFNITNPASVLRGATVEVEELGPFVFKHCTYRSGFEWDKGNK